MAFVAGSLTFIPKPSHADETANSEVSVQITPSIASALSPNTLALPINPTPTGQEAKGELSIDVSTNNQTGYNLTMSTTSAVTALTHTDGVSTMPTVTNTTAGIPNALANNTWGYNIGLASATTTFLSTPALGSAIQLKETTAPAQSSTTTITIGAKATTAIPAGSYANTLLFTVAANSLPPSPTITSISPDASLPAGGVPITITGTNFTTPASVTIGGIACTSVTVVSDTTITCVVPGGTLGSKTVAVSTATSRGTSADAFTYLPAVQEFSSALCADLAPGETIRRIDSRDNVGYRIRKMIDDRCWFIDNLAFALDNAAAPAFSPVASLSIVGTNNVTTQAQYAQNNNFEGQGQIPNNGNPIPSYLYNWCAALGDTSTNCSASVAAAANQTVINGNTTTTTSTATNQPAVTGICPAPFRLPKGGPGSSPAYTPASTANEFVKLDIALGGTGEDWQDYAASYANWMSAANSSSSWSGVLSGYFNSSLVNQASSGYWWSSTAYSSTSAYVLDLGSSSSYVYPAGYGNRYLGLAVRCVL